MSTFQPLLGQRINGVLIGNDKWTLVFRTVEGKHFRFDTQNDCCNSVWINHVTGLSVVGDGNVFDILRGAEVLAVEDKGWNDNREGEDGYEVIQDGFWTIRTDRGYIDIEVRNSHNGYYGGSLVFSGQDNIEDIDDLQEVVEDF
jgi:hypothetical protein